MKKPDLIVGLWLIAGLLLLTALPWTTIVEKLEINRVSLEAASAYQSGKELNYQQVWLDLQPLADKNCRVNWMIGIIEDSLQVQDRAQASWKKLLDCNEDYIPLLRWVSNDNLELATYAFALYPQNKSALYWYAEALETQKLKEQTLVVYQQLTDLYPLEGLAWCRQGNLQSGMENWQKALDAYLQCCYNGDPGVNGCYGAGRMAEKLNDPQSAIRYYRLSRWQPSRDKADELEGNIQIETP